MRRTIGLDGEWERRDFIDEAWRWSDALRLTAEDGSDDGPPVKPGVSAGWRTARVPGSAIDDAWRAGEVPNPYVDRDSLAAEWVPERTWLYRRSFDVPPDAPPHAALRFEGLDPGGTVLLDGDEIATHRGMFVPLEVDVSERLRAGTQHSLVVAVDRAPWMPSQVSRTDLAREHRTRMAYGWDFCPRMVHTGIWRSVSLSLFDARLGRPRIEVTLERDLESAAVSVRVPIEGDGARTLSARVRAPDGAVVVASTHQVEDGKAHLHLEVDRPRLWWPNGIGEPALHRLELALDGQEPMDALSIPFGIRTIEAAPNEDAPAAALPYTLVVNGRPTWARGWNWTPIDACHGVPRPARLAHLVELARRANVNLLRVWGGGLIESDDFYDACDRAGIMVWQEFIQSSSGVANTPSDDPHFVELMRREAEAIVPLRAHHPSLAIWGGGNELAGADGRPLDDAHPVLAALHDVVATLDPTRIWLPTSPTGPRFDNSLSAIADDPAGLHDVHGPWEHQGLAAQHALADATTSLLHGEFGVEGMTNLATLRATVTAPERWTADRSDPVMAHRGAWWNNRPFVERVFGGDLTLDELERASHHLQADGLRTLIEGDRRRWPRNAGALPWVFNEPFPNAWSNAAIDYFGVPKPAYHAAAETYAPVAIGLSFRSQALDGADRIDVRAWVMNDTDRTFGGPMRLALHDVTGRLLAEASQCMDVPANASTASDESALSVPEDAADLLVLDASFAEAVTRRILSRTASLEPMRHLAPAGLAATVAAEGDRWLVELAATGPAAAVEVRLSDDRAVGWPEPVGAAYLDANNVTVLPSEKRIVCVDWRDVTPAERRLRISGWNIVERVVTDG